uniref:CWF21 domain-containing protein n=1 Tax=Seriola lalandi dorsalis TaxID=1841481 RepID=A0A3B4WJ88_SERLL
MYNGIGLTTPRGSGTNGYVQRNLSSLRVKRPRDERGGERDEKDRERLESQLNRQPNADILEHQRKRQLEVKCAELQDMMEEQGYSAEEIEEKVNSFRMMLQEKQEPAPATTERPTVTETHALAAANQQKNDRLRAAFGIASDYVDGSSFHADRKEREKEKREQERLERERLQQQKYTLVEDSDSSDSPPKKHGRKKKKKNKNRDSSESPSPSPRREKKKSRKKKKKRYSTARFFFFF